MEKKPFIHPSSFIDEDVEIGEGTKIWHFCHIQSGARIGARLSFADGQTECIACGRRYQKVGNEVMKDMTLTGEQMFVGRGQILSSKGYHVTYFSAGFNCRHVEAA